MSKNQLDRHDSEGCNLSSQETIRQALREAVFETLTKDWDLVALGCHEQAIAHRLAVYLERHFPNYHTDCEYNRREVSLKDYSDDLEESRNMRPDILVHKRISGPNLLAIEMKANNKNIGSNDPQKLKALASDPKYRYEATSFVRIFNSLQDIKDGLLRAEIEWYDLSANGIEAGSIESIDVANLATKVLEIYEARRTEARARRR